MLLTLSPPVVSAAPRSQAAQTSVAAPDQLFGDLFVRVQSRRIFPDSKTFPDMEPLRAPKAIMAAWHRERPRDDAAIRAFVLRNFSAPAETSTVQPPAGQAIDAHIQALWPVLTRRPDARTLYSSELALPRPYVVPGGRFREIYYWDSYFTMLGLRADGHEQLIEDMLDDFTSLVERYGHVPNGTRSYYLSRSQPPFLALMMGLSKNADRKVRIRRLAALRREHAFWMRGLERARPGRPCDRVVRLPDGSTLNRYWDDNATPRPESYAEDVETARNSGRPNARVYRDIRAAAESGWDFSSRWLADGRTLASIQTTSLVPADLNSLLYAAERRIAAECDATGETTCATEYAYMAERRAAAIRKSLWVADEGRFADWNWVRHAPVAGLSAATLYPLFVGAATPGQARAVADTVEGKLLAPGGLRTTLATTGQQWDVPNGWAPLQWIGVEGLKQYGFTALAGQIAQRWRTTVACGYEQSGKLLEKYDVEEQRPGGGGEYPTQDGFGWTNGVLRALGNDPRCSAAP